MASGRSQWWQGSLPSIWRRPITGDAVDHGVGGLQTRRDLVAAGLAHHDPGDRRLLAVDPADGPEGGDAARRGRACPTPTPVTCVCCPSPQRGPGRATQRPAAPVEPVLTPTNPLCPSSM